MAQTQPTVEKFVDRLIIGLGVVTENHKRKLRALIRVRDDIPEASRRKLVAALSKLIADFETVARRLEE